MPDQIQFSIIVPTYNRLAQLRSVVTSLIEQDFSHEFEIIVVNDGSTDDTGDFLRTAQEIGKLVALTQNNQGPSAARNRGIEQARGEFIAFIDDDCEAPKDWLAAFSRVLEDNSIAGCGGLTISHSSASLYGLTIDHMVNFFKTSVNALRRVANGSEAPFLTSNNVAYRTSVLRKVGGFDKRFRIGAEERDLNNRIIRAGHRLKFEPSINVIHWHRTTLAGFLRHQMDQGRGSYKLYRQAGTSVPSETIPVSTYIQLLFSPFKRFSVWKGFAVAVLILLAHFMIVLGYLSASLEARRVEVQKVREVR